MRIPVEKVKFVNGYVVFDNRIWEADPQTDDQSRLYIYYNHPVHGTDESECVEMATLVPVYSLKGNLPQIAWEIEEYRYKDNGWKDADIYAVVRRLG